MTVTNADIPESVGPWQAPERPGGRSRRRWRMALVIALLVGAVTVWKIESNAPAHRADVGYERFRSLVRDDVVQSIAYDADTGRITGTFSGSYTEHGRSEFEAHGPRTQLPDDDIALLNEHHVGRDYKSGASDWASGLLYFVLPFALLPFLGGVVAMGVVQYQRRQR